MTYATINLAWAHLYCGELEEGEQLLEEVLPLIRQLGSHEALAWYWLAKSMRPFWRADVARFRDFAEQALSAARAVGDPASEGIADALIGAAETSQGRFEAAVERLEASRERMIAAGSGLALRYTETFLAQARASVGDVATARAALESVIASGADFGMILGWATAILAELLRCSGDPGAEARASEALQIGERMQSPAIIGVAKEALGRLAAARGELGRAEELSHEALVQHLKHGVWRFVPQTLDALAEIAAGFDSHEEAGRVLGVAQRARSELGLVRWPPHQPRIAELEGVLREQLGDADFEHAVEEGAALSRDDAVTWVRHARGERRRPERGWESLTPTELRVVRLVAEGLTNPQIGERMFISRGTVKVHLSHVFAKLNIATRTELAAEATRRGLELEQ